MSGYCTHISVLFPTWHRPYVSLYEVRRRTRCFSRIEAPFHRPLLTLFDPDTQNVLYSVIQDIVSLWPNVQDRTRYQAAASNFRIPYWDWAANPPAGESVLPKSIGGSVFVDVNGPNGEQRIANPLFSYEFKPLDRPDFLDTAPVSPVSLVSSIANTILKWDVWTSTVRAPTTNTTSAQSNNTWVEKALGQNLASLQQRLYNLFSNYGNYTEFSNEGWIPDQSNTSYDSLESVHDTVHNIAGGGTGHMAYIPFSAFDPVFFLHHANVDRLFAMWQALYPNSWISPSPAIVNSYTASAGEIQDSKTALTPFYAKTDGTFWDSDMVRDPKVLGYSYQEVAGVSLAGGKGNQKIQSRVRTAVNRLYGQPSPASLALKWKSGLRPGMRIPASLVADGRYREWIANIRVDKQGLGGPFFIHLFLDSVPGDSATWAFADNLVGTMSVFAAPNMKGMDMGGLHISGTVPLTAALKERVLEEKLDSLEAGDIKPYLRKYLKVAVRTAGGEVVDMGGIPSLHIYITSSGVRAPTRDDQLPTWDGEVTSHFDFV